MGIVLFNSLQLLLFKLDLIYATRHGVSHVEIVIPDKFRNDVSDFADLCHFDQ
jgi:hypothetical protein